MAIGLVNDYGKVVSAVGMPGSFADTMNRYPKLTQRLIYLHDSQALISDAIREIMQAGVYEDDVVEVLLIASYYLEPSERLGAVGYLDWTLR